MSNIASTDAGGKWGIEWWYTAHFVYGVIQMVFIPILIPTYILDMTGKASDVGIVMAIIGLGGLLAPVLGGIADKYRAHRVVQLVGLLAYAAGGACFAFSGSVTVMYILAAVFMGVGSATMLMLNPAFIVSAGFDQKSEALRLTRLNQIAIVGSLVAGLGLGALTNAGLSFASRFLVMSGIAIVAMLITAATNRAAAARIKVDRPVDEADTEPKPGVLSVLFSNFGLMLLAVFFVTTGHGVITGQYPNYMQDVFGIEASASSVGLSVSAVITLVLLTGVGKWMGVKGPSPVWLTGVGMKVVVMVLLSLLALMLPGATAMIPLALYIIYLQGISWADMVQPALASRASSLGAGATQGFLLFSIAIAYALGNVIGGASADSLGFKSLTWIVAAVSTVALFIGMISFRKIKEN